MGHYEHWREDLALVRELGSQGGALGRAVVPGRAVSARGVRLALDRPGDPLPGRGAGGHADRRPHALRLPLLAAPRVRERRLSGGRGGLRRGVRRALRAGWCAGTRRSTSRSSTRSSAASGGSGRPTCAATAATSRSCCSSSRGSSRTVDAIKEVDPDAIMVHVEATGLSRTAREDLHAVALEEQRRGFLAYDLLTGRVTPDHPLFTWLVRNGAVPDELAAIAARPVPFDLMGLNFYPQWSTTQLYIDRNGRLAYQPVEQDGAGLRRADRGLLPTATGSRSWSPRRAPGATRRARALARGVGRGDPRPARAGACRCSATPGSRCSR